MKLRLFSRFIEAYIVRSAIQNIWLDHVAYTWFKRMSKILSGGTKLKKIICIWEYKEGEGISIQEKSCVCFKNGSYSALLRNVFWITCLEFHWKDWSALVLYACSVYMYCQCICDTVNVEHRLMTIYLATDWS